MTSDAGTDAALRAAFQASGDPPPDPDACPRPEVILQAVRGELPPAELRAVVAHTATCADCAEDWRLAAAYLRELSDAQEGSLPAASSSPTRARPAAWRRWAVAAAAMALVALGLGWRFGFGTGDPAYRDGRPRAVRSLLPERAELPAESFVLRWEAVPGAASYEAQVSTGALALVAAAKDLSAPTYQVPAASLAGVPPGSLLYWQITAVLGDGHRLTSPTFSVLLR